MVQNVISDCISFNHNGVSLYTIDQQLPYSLKFSRDKYFTVLPNSAEKQIFTDKIFVV